MFAKMRSLQLFDQFRSYGLLRQFMPVRNMSSVLGDLQPSPGKKKRKRTGRGAGSGRGGHTAGWGQNGQKSRSGWKLPTPGFAGGQNRINTLFPKWGIMPKKEQPRRLNLVRLQQFIQEGRIDASKPIDMAVIKRSGCLTNIKYGVKLLGRGADDFDTPVTISVSRASKMAIEAVEAVGGHITTVYHNKLSLDGHLRPGRYNGKPPAQPMPIRRKDVEYYRNPENRGYLAYMPELPPYVPKKKAATISRSNDQEFNALLEPLGYDKPIAHKNLA